MDKPEDENLYKELNSNNKFNFLKLLLSLLLSFFVLFIYINYSKEFTFFKTLKSSLGFVFLLLVFYTVYCFNDKINFLNKYKIDEIIGLYTKVIYLFLFFFFSVIISIPTVYFLTYIFGTVPFFLIIFFLDISVVVLLLKSILKELNLTIQLPFYPIIIVLLLILISILFIIEQVFIRKSLDISSITAKLIVLEVLILVFNVFFMNKIVEKKKWFLI